MRRLAAIVIGLGALLVGASCAPPGEPASAPESMGVAHTLTSSVVPLMRRQVLSDEDGVPERVAWRPFCNAFTVGELLATAAHCVPEGRGADVRFVPPNGWGLGRARVVVCDNTHDVAWLQPSESYGLVPLHVAPAPIAGSDVWSYSAVFNESHQGFMGAQLAYWMHETTMTIYKGWSGSPVLDSHGRVWGVTAACNPRDEAPHECLPRESRIALLGEMP